jgi:hypothetical protein
MLAGKNLKEGTIHASTASLQEETLLFRNVTKGACPCRAFLLFHSDANPCFSTQFKKLPDYALHTRHRAIDVDVIQLTLPDIDESQQQTASSF